MYWSKIKDMKSVLTLLFITTLFLGFSQTKRIAHLSHSGSLDAFSPKGFDSYGLPPMTIDSLIFINDTTLVQISSIGGDWHVQKDTMVNHPLMLDDEIDVDSMKYYYRYDDTKFVGFEGSRKCPAPSISNNSNTGNVRVNMASDTDDNTNQVELELLKDNEPENTEFECNTDEDKDSTVVDTLVEPKEKIISREGYKKNDAIPVVGPSDVDGGTFFRWTVGVLFALSFLFFVFLNYRQSKLA